MSKVYESTFGELICTACGTVLECNDCGDMPLLCPFCRSRLKYSPTKKQIKAMQDIIAGYQKALDAQNKFDNEDRREKKLPPLPRHICGEQKTPTGYSITDSYVGVYYHTSVPELPHDDEYLDERDIIYGHLKRAEDADCFMVDAPFCGEIKSSKIRELLKQHSSPHPCNPRASIIRLSASFDGKTLEGVFNSLYVRRAVEALGGQVRLYLTQRQNPPALIIRQAGVQTLDKGAHAIVMPINVK